MKPYFHSLRKTVTVSASVKDFSPADRLELMAEIMRSFDIERLPEDHTALGAARVVYDHCRVKAREQDTQKAEVTRLRLRGGPDWDRK
jgi:hypothetical protein